jgi:CubicO group peptidase (beta-lactamase class C family)
VDYTPQSGGDWPVSTPEGQGLDPDLVAELYLNAAGVETIRSLLVVKNGHLIAEGYFHDGALDQKARIQSVTKSITSALVGLAEEKGCLSSVDQKAVEFFPELADQMSDSRKNDITVRHLLQMRAGFPWEESSQEMFNLMYSGFRPSILADVPLVRDPGAGMEYSNVTSHLLSIIVSRACGVDLLDFANEYLFGPLGIEPGEWIADWEGYRNGHADLHLRARDMAKFGLMYLDEGQWQGEQIVPAEWVQESQQVYSQDAWPFRIGRNYKDMSYGYQWWSARAGDRRWFFAWGHGGQQIALVEDLDMVIVVTADPLHGQHGDQPWRYEKENLNLVGDFIAELPGE